MPPSFPYAERARLAREAQAELHDSFSRVTRRDDDADPATARWNASIQALGARLRAAYPPEFWVDLERLRGGDASRVETFVEFLEADPMFFRSGYVKADVVRYLKRIPLNPDQVERLRRVVLHVVTTRRARELRDYARLALKLDGTEFRARLQVIATSPAIGPARRASRILATLPFQPGGPPRDWRRSAAS